MGIKKHLRTHNRSALEVDRQQHEKTTADLTSVSQEQEPDAALSPDITKLDSWGLAKAQAMLPLSSTVQLCALESQDISSSWNTQTNNCAWGKDSEITFFTVLILESS